MNTAAIHALDNDALLGAVTTTVHQANGLMVHLLRLLIEVENRRLFARLGFPSMFAFVTRRLGLSESAAYKRIHAARAARSHPSILDLLARGRLHLSAIAQLTPHLTQANAGDLLEAAQGKSKEALQELLAVRFAQQAPRSRLRRLPSVKPVGLLTNTTGSASLRAPSRCRRRPSTRQPPPRTRRGNPAVTPYRRQVPPPRTRWGNPAVTTPYRRQAALPVLQPRNPRPATQRHSRQRTARRCLLRPRRPQRQRQPPLSLTGCRSPSTPRPTRLSAPCKVCSVRKRTAMISTPSSRLRCSPRAISCCSDVMRFDRPTFLWPRFRNPCPPAKHRPRFHPCRRQRRVGRTAWPRPSLPSARRRRPSRLRGCQLHHRHHHRPHACTPGPPQLRHHPPPGGGIYPLSSSDPSICATVGAVSFVPPTARAALPATSSIITSFPTGAAVSIACRISH